MNGAEQMIGRLKAIQKRFPDRVKTALYQEAQIEMTESKRRCPVDVSEHAPHPGLLRSSGRVATPTRDARGNISVILSYGGGAVTYAVYVHEMLMNYHKVGQAKYLESVLNESRSTMLGRIARRIQLNEEHVA